MTAELGFIVDQQGNIITHQEIEARLAEALKAVESFRDAFLSGFVPAYVAWAEALQHWYNSLVAPVEVQWLFSGSDDPLAEIPYYDREPACRQYAERYNQRHAGRRVSWRRLSRPQRATAAQEWLAENAHS